MKQILLSYVFSLFLLTTLWSQTITWTGAGDGVNWSDPDNWDLTAVPAAGNDVVLPSGSVSTINTDFNIQSIVLNGTAVVTANGPLFISAGTSVIWDDATFNWNGSAIGGGGTLTNRGILNLSGGILTGTTSLYILGTMNFVDSVCYLNDGAQLFIQPAGTIDIQANEAAFLSTSGTYIFYNYGTIKRSGGTGTVTIFTEFRNLAGTISVESGKLDLRNPDIDLVNGTYNVSSGAELTWTDIVNVSGPMTGVLDGNFNWASTMNLTSETTFNFTGSAGVNWSNGDLVGGETLINNDLINVTAVGNHLIMENSTIENNGNITIQDGADLRIGYGTINNESGTIDLKGDNSKITSGTGAVKVLNNNGSILKSGTVGTSTISAELQNNNAQIQVETGVLNIDNANTTFTNGTYNVALGSSMNWTDAVTCSGMLTGLLDGDLDISLRMIVPTAATFDFTGNETITWSEGILSGGGILTNKDVMNLTMSSGKIINENTTLTNEGTINLTDFFCALYIDDGTVNNLDTGTIDLMENETLLGFSGGSNHILNNYGTIKQTTGASSSDSFIYAELHNFGGTLIADGGNFILNNVNMAFEDGTFNVTTGNTMSWNNTINCTGVLNGTVEGDLLWRGDLIVPSAETAIFSFDGPFVDNGINWSSGTLKGGGTLVNEGYMYSEVITGNKVISENTTFNNEGVLDFTFDAGTLYINDGVLNNQLSGIMEIDDIFISFSGGATHTLNNYGLLEKQGGFTTNVYVNTHNYGVIDISSGTLSFDGSLGLTNYEDAVIKGSGRLVLPASPGNFSNSGTVSPGASAGTLIIEGDFTSSPSSIFEAELDGLLQGSNYDYLDIFGNAIMDGTVDITLAFEPALNDEFIVATTTGNITSCNLVSTATASYSGSQYNFSVECRNSNEVVLTVTEILNVDTFELTEKDILLYPNPTNGIFTLRNNSSFQLLSAKIHDISGRLLATIDLTDMNQEKNLSLSNFVSGYYFVTIGTENAKLTKRMVKR